ncbi:MAG: hypothetical protein JWM95_508 [Gemmatimonadetes bacterium]|nr:hypothetical protein [Gemmatimonadota bacterium]
MRSSTFRFLVAAAIVAPAAAGAQGTLSTLGFGYPTGQLSTRALGTGGALGEQDPLSASNPAVIGALGGAAVYFQADPEYRTLHIGGATEKTSIARFPLIVGSIPITPRVLIGLSASNLLDRSFETYNRGVQRVGDTTLATSNSFKSDGAIGDLRFAIAWAPLNWLHVGGALHAISGDNRISNTQIFDDSAQFARLVDTATVGYTGNAQSVGFELVAGTYGSIAGSYRHGGPLSLKRGDTTIANAHVPDRVAIGAAFSGIKGLTFAARTAKDTWSAMQALGSSNLKITDGWDTSAGIDAMGPKFQEKVIQLRAGARWRTLPFGTATSSVSEKSFSFGAGTLMSRGRAALDMAAIRATRNAGASMSETSWTLSIGVTVRP